MGLTESSFLERMEEMGFTVRKSNADRIRAMTDEELAAFLCNQQDVTGCSGCVAIDFCHYGHNGMIDWLKQIEVHGTDEGGGIRYDECGNVIDYGIVGPPGEPGVKEEATDGK